MVERLTKCMVWAAGAALIVMSFIITAEALLRKFANYSLGSVNEMSAYLFAVTSAWAFAWALISGAHIRIGIVRGLFNRRTRAVLDIISLLVFIAVFALISFRAADLAWESYVTGARAPSASRTLLYIPQSLWALGLIVTVLAGLHLLVRVIRERSTAMIAPGDEVESELENHQ